MSEQTKRITLARGDGIGPEITDAVVRILQAANAPLEYDEIEVGEKVYGRGVSSGIPEDAWDTIRKNRVVLKGPISTPQGGGYKSLNVTLRKTLGLFANVRQCKAYTPYVSSSHPGLDMVIIRENEEDLYAGIEYQQTAEVVQALKLISRAGSESIVRYAFEYARAYGRKKVTCMTKDNIMKRADGLFHQVFDRVSEEYPDIESNHQIIDIGAAIVAAKPETLDVIVTMNLYGDIISDIAALVAGSVGLAGSANIGTDYAMFEAIHGSAPDIAGKGIANPSGMLVAATMMLVHLGYPEHAAAVANGWMKTLEDGIHTGEIYKEGLSKERVGTKGFADAVIERLGQRPERLRSVDYSHHEIKIVLSKPARRKKTLVGVDVFVDWVGAGRRVDVLGELAKESDDDKLALRLISSRGVKVYPNAQVEDADSDHWRCRFVGDGPVAFADVLALQGRLSAAGLDVIKTENLYEFDGERGYSLAQGE